MCRGDNVAVCNDGRRICEVQQCDGTADCAGGEDELNCPQSEGTRQQRTGAASPSGGVSAAQTGSLVCPFLPGSSILTFLRGPSTILPYLALQLFPSYMILAYIGAARGGGQRVS